MDRLTTDIEFASLALTLIIVAIALILGWFERLERASRPEPSSDEDRDHYNRRDHRRSTGLTLLCLVGLGIFVGSRIPIHRDGTSNLAFVMLWLTIFSMIFALLALALKDWRELRLFARRHRQMIIRERWKIVEDEARRSRSAESRPARRPEREVP